MNEELHSILRPYLLRRTKSGVLKDLPEKSDVVLYHGLSKLQKKLYKAILTKDIGEAFTCMAWCVCSVETSLKNHHTERDNHHDQHTRELINAQNM